MVIPNIVFGTSEIRMHTNGVSVARYPANEILNWIKNQQKKYSKKNGKKPIRMPFVRDKISVTVRRKAKSYTLFRKSCECISCGRVGNMMSLSSDPGNNDAHHFDLYCVENGKAILMTKDHIIPKAKQGANTLSNYQVMCEPCNTNKGDKLI